jgi:SAM-dependent methyltransferase
MTDYYTRRAMQPIEGPYYGTRKDPDGVPREQTSDHEYALSVADVRAEAAALTGCKSVIDIGCGPASVAHYFQPSGDYPHLADYLGVDPDPDARTAGATRHPWAKFVSMLERNHESVATCDGLISYHAVEHMVYPERVIGDALTHCVRGARVVISTPDFGSPCARQFGKRFRMLHDPTHISLFTTAGLVCMLQDLGVAIDRVVYPFRGTRWERAASEWVDTGDNWSPPAPGNVVSVYGWVQ